MAEWFLEPIVRRSKEVQALIEAKQALEEQVGYYKEQVQFLLRMIGEAGERERQAQQEIERLRQERENLLQENQELARRIEEQQETIFLLEVRLQELEQELSIAGPAEQTTEIPSLSVAEDALPEAAWGNSGPYGEDLPREVVDGLNQLLVRGEKSPEEKLLEILAGRWVDKYPELFADAQPPSETTESTGPGHRGTLRSLLELVAGLERIARDGLAFRSDCIIEALSYKWGGDYAEILGLPRWENALTPEELERRHGRYWGNCPREWMDQLIAHLAWGEECRRNQLLESMRLVWGARTAALFRTAIEGDWVEERTARLLRGHPLSLLGLTQAGRSLAADMGLESRRGLSELLARHRTPEQALLALMARDLLAEWKHFVHIWPSRFRTPSGRDCRPDLVAVDPNRERIFVELEVHPVISTDYSRKAARITKWTIFHEVNRGCLYIILPSQEREARMLHEITLWSRVTRLPVVLFTTNVTHPGERWTVNKIR